MGIPSYQIDAESEINYEPLPMSQTFQHLKDYSRGRNKRPVIPNTSYQVSQTSVGFMKSNNHIPSRQIEQQNQYLNQQSQYQNQNQQNQYQNHQNQYQNQQNNQNFNMSIYQLQ